MTEQLAKLLADDTLRAGLRQAWDDSQPDSPDPHEEGGFILKDASGALDILRWPAGKKRTIMVPPHQSGRLAIGKSLLRFILIPIPGSASCRNRVKQTREPCATTPT